MSKSNTYIPTNASGIEIVAIIITQTTYVATIATQNTGMLQYYATDGFLCEVARPIKIRCIKIPHARNFSGDFGRGIIVDSEYAIVSILKLQLVLIVNPF